jgi:hypothetical protein
MTTIETGGKMIKKLSQLINRDFRNNNTLKCKIQSEVFGEFGKFSKFPKMFYSFEYGVHCC